MIIIISYYRFDLSEKNSVLCKQMIKNEMKKIMLLDIDDNE